MHLIGFVGHAQNGKSTAAKHVVDNHNGVEVNFARIIKDVASKYLGLADDQLYGDQKETMIADGPMVGWTPRAIMQDIGDWLKSYNGWIFINDAKEQIESATVAGRVAVVGDVRMPPHTVKQTILGVEYNKEMPGESSLIKEMGGLIVRVERIGFKSKTDSMGIAKHKSEALIDSIVPDFIIRASNTANLCRYVDVILNFEHYNDIESACPSYSNETQGIEEVVGPTHWASILSRDSVDADARASAA